jgi:hypothetical protein
VSWNSGVMVAYGDTVHTTSKGISPDLIVHEQTHFRQQAAIGGPEIWWEKYFTDKQFRLEQELEAYEKQCDHIRKFVFNQKKKHNAFNHIWLSMAQMYGDMITFEEAAELLPIHKKL